MQCKQSKKQGALSTKDGDDREEKKTSWALLPGWCLKPDFPYVYEGKMIVETQRAIQTMC